jgi:hypothetical protein
VGKAIVAVLAVALTAGRAPARADDAPAPGALTVRGVRPEEQGERLLGLFRGARAPDPAAALAAWKHATAGRASLGKPLEAAIAVLNRPMLTELRNLHGARLDLGFEAGTGRVRWRAVVPGDDGSIAALASALALTDGACEEPIGEVAVLRLGPPGAAVAAQRPGRLALASARDGLRLALDEPDPPVDADDPGPGWHARLDPAGLRGLPSVAGRRLAEAFDAVGCREARGWLALDDETLTLRVTAALDPRPWGKASLDPSWLDMVPASGALAAASVALDTTPEGLEAAFGALDRVERADPARAGVAPLRTRLNLVAAAARVRLEADLWPALKGLTAAVLVDDAGELTGAIVALHATDPAAADRIAGEVLPRLASAIVRAGKPSDPRPDGAQPLGAVDGKAVIAATRGRNVLIGWGDGSLDAALGALDRPARSAGPLVRSGWGASPPQRAGAFWPGRLRRVAPPGSPLSRGLAGAPPIVWEGRTEVGSARDLVRWANLRGVVRRWLDALPLDPPPGG